jgi:hypothetical protein
MSAKCAILIVNGGNSRLANRWIELCLSKIAAYTQYPNYQIYVWNNRSQDQPLEAWLLAQPRLTLLSAAGYETLCHPHRTPLQRLYTLAREEGATYIVTLDSDAHPLRSGWLTELLTQVAAGAALAGVWRAEMTPAIRPHVHPSCLCTTVDFIEQHQLRFDFDNTHSTEMSDTLAHFTWVAEAHGQPIYRLLRTNQRSFHEWMGGIYGNLIYHHVAASRERVLFHNTRTRDLFQIDAHQALRNATEKLLFSHYEHYMGWLQGKAVDPQVQQFMAHICAGARQDRSRHWWLARARSPYLQQAAIKKFHTKLKAKVSVAPSVSQLYAKVNRAASKLSNLLPGDGQGQAAASVNVLTTAFGEAHLYPLPTHGWTTHAPDFIGIGAPKSGTSFFHNLLLQHPQIVHPRIRFGNPRRKETQYFVHFQYHELSAADIATYHAAFATPPGAICGEFSVLYLAYPACLEQLALAAPHAKILVLLRNPIDRFISHLNHLMTKRGRHFFGNATVQQEYLLHAFSFYSEAALHSLYSVGLARLYQYFNRDQILILPYEQLQQTPEAQLAHAYRFLGVDDRFRARGYGERVNQGAYALPQPDPSERRRVAAYFAEDVKRTFALCPELDPALWPDFADLG